MEYWWQRVEEVSPNWTQLRNVCRAAGIEVMYTVIQSLTADGRDQSLDYKISGFHVPPGSFDAEVSISSLYLLCALCSCIICICHHITELGGCQSSASHQSCCGSISSQPQ